MVNPEEAHEKYMAACNGGKDGDRYFAEHMIRFGFTIAWIITDPEDSKNAMKLEMRRAFEYFIVRGFLIKDKLITNALVWAYNYGKSFYDPLEKIHVTEKERDDEFERFFELYMETIMS
eukprot:TRINITY_DN2424_c0_g1_i2.p1 TRINITY_DN2424_c0_g1~~TRINITY_DN2424_c0_g1_i2.p1  ORF type:complete len:119 (-),score=4.57 TRINITY_DN2424_c0_g1_i2:80-436(-)